MDYTEIRITSPEESTPIIEYILQRHLIQGWVEEKSSEGVSLIFFLPVDSSDDLIDSIGKNINSKSVKGSSISTRIVLGEDWEHSWKKCFRTRKIGNLIIKPTWETYTSKPGETVIEIDPGMAFGTGEHGTTVLCLQFLQEHIRKGFRVLDMGTGSGILAIASLYLGAETVTAVDYDPIALGVAEDNLKRLGFIEKVTLMKQDVLSLHLSDFDIVTGNLFLTEIQSLLKNGCPPLKKGGIFIGSGITTDQRSNVLETATQSPFTDFIWKSRDVWDAFTAIKSR